MAAVSAALASIPSPSTGVYHLGPFTLHMYGLMLLLAIAGALWLTGKRWVRFGGAWDLVFRVAIYGVIAGIIGARVYHDITSWNQDSAIHAHWYGPFAVWSGGLGIWGAIPLGVLAGAWVVRRSGNSIRLFMDAVAPGLLLAQGIGRWGNWFNQELYGKPTNLPWGLEIDSSHRPVQYLNHATFHPTFLYEMLFDFAAAGFLIWLGRRDRIRPPGLFALYVTLYSFGRFWIEALRVDPAHHIAGLRLNDWVAAIGFVGGLIWFRRTQRQGGNTPRLRRRKPKPAAPPPAMAVPKGRVRPGR